jgi:hypothetical protein
MASTFLGCLEQKTRISLSAPGRTSSIALLLLASLTLWAAAICQAKETCPWLNEATAAGFLDGTVTANVTHPYKDKDDANCEFIHREGTIVTVLQIEVETMSDKQFPSYLGKCGANPQPVKAIGNQAVACTLNEKKGRYSELVIGRVRERAFVVRISSNTDESTRETLRERAKRIAEQVAGFLF